MLYILLHALSPLADTFPLLADNLQGPCSVVLVVTNQISAFISARSLETLSQLVHFPCLE